MWNPRCFFSHGIVDCIKYPGIGASCSEKCCDGLKNTVAVMTPTSLFWSPRQPVAHCPQRKKATLTSSAMSWKSGEVAVNTRHERVNDLTHFGPTSVALWKSQVASILFGQGYYYSTPLKCLGISWSSQGASCQRHERCTHRVCVTLGRRVIQAPEYYTYSAGHTG